MSIPCFSSHDWWSWKWSWLLISLLMGGNTWWKQKDEDDRRQYAEKKEGNPGTSNSTPGHHHSVTLVLSPGAWNKRHRYLEPIIGSNRLQPLILAGFRFKYKCVLVTWLDQLRWWDQVLVGDTGRCASLAYSQWQCVHCTWQLCANPKSKLCLLAIASLRHPWRVRLEKNAISEALDVRERCR